MRFVRYRRAVEKWQALAEACESVRHWPPEDPFLVQAYVFGRLLTGDDSVHTVEVVLMLNLPPRRSLGIEPEGHRLAGGHATARQGRLQLMVAVSP